jgi:hypothetical protein
MIEKSRRELLEIGVKNAILRALDDLKYTGTFLSSQSEISNANESEEYKNAKDAIEKYKDYLLKEIKKI